MDEIDKMHFLAEFPHNWAMLSSIIKNARFHYIPLTQIFEHWLGVFDADALSKLIVDSDGFDDYLDSMKKKIKTINACGELKIENNELKNFPENICQLELKNLSINKTKIDKLPDYISCLGILERLDLDDNQILGIPQSIEKMKNLMHIYACNNKITTIPRDILNLEKLRHVDFRCNPLNDFSKQILKELAMSLGHQNSLFD